MRTLNELKGFLASVPKPFANDAETSDVSDFNNTENDTTNYLNGFPKVFSQNPKDKTIANKGKWLLRSDLNAFGQMATKEAFFKETGGVHTYDEKVAETYKGYPEGVVLTSFDGEYLSLVESQEGKNHYSFLDDLKKTDYSVVNCEVQYQGDEKEPRILWKSVNWINGLEEGLYHLYINYSNAHQIEEDTPIEKDSLVIGTRACFRHLPPPGLSGGGIQPSLYNIDTTSFPLEHETQINDVSIQVINKGKFGDAAGSGVYVAVQGAMVPVFYDIPIVSYTGGTGNYYNAFFAKAGTKISTILKVNGSAVPEYAPYWYAIPIEAQREDT